MGLECLLAALGSAMNVGKMDRHKDKAVCVLGERVCKWGVGETLFQVLRGLSSHPSSTSDSPWNAKGSHLPWLWDSGFSPLWRVYKAK